jgi:hypothetical protein
VPRDLHPSDGARYLLEREAEPEPGVASATAAGAAGASTSVGRAPTHVRYRAAIYTRDAEFVTTAVLGEDGSAELGPTGAPDELHARLVAQARLVARDAARQRDSGMPPWPQRILRWRR